MPSIGFEALRRVVAEPALHFAVDGDTVVVVDGDELAQSPCPGERARLVRNPLHKAAVADRDVGVVIDQIEARAIELGREQAFGERHADRVRQALPQRARRGLHARSQPVLRVTRRLRVQLPKALQLLHRQVVAGEVQERVEQHRTVPVGDDEAVAAGPIWIGRVVTQVPAPQSQRDLGHPHGHAGVARIRRLHGIHGQRANRVGQVLAHLRGKIRDGGLKPYNYPRISLA